MSSSSSLCSQHIKSKNKCQQLSERRRKKEIRKKEEKKEEEEIVSTVHTV
jgi:hypothetical protein